MALNNSRKSIIARRRSTVSRMLLVFRRTQREMAQSLNVSLGTINNDIKALNAEWRRQTTQHVDTLRGQQIAEIGEVKHLAWMGGEPAHLRLLLQAIKLEAQITGTIAPPSYAFNITFLMPLAKAIEDSGIPASEVYEAFMQSLAQRKQEGLRDENGHGQGTPVGQEIADHHHDQRR